MLDGGLSITLERREERREDLWSMEKCADNEARENEGATAVWGNSANTIVYLVCLPRTADNNSGVLLLPFHPRC